MNLVFDYRGLRFLLGLIAFSLPPIVYLLAQGSLPVCASSLESISSSYYTDARNVFVGMLFVVAAFMFAYNGHGPREFIASKVASLTAVVVALCPTASCEQGGGMVSALHYIAAVILFATLTYFCFGPFQRNLKRQKGKKGLRSRIYLLCGWTMVVSMVAVFVNWLFDIHPDVVFWGETFALEAFGLAWIVAGKVITPLVDPEDAYRPFSKRAN